MKRYSIVSFLMILFLGTGCKKTETSNQNVEIGALLSLRGNWSSLGITSQEAINLAITDVNAFMLQKGNNLKFSTNLVPDAYALAAYDAVWVIARTVESMRSSGNEYTTVKNIFKAEAGKFFGITGQTVLNPAGDRSQGAFDYWGIAPDNGKYKWALKVNPANYSII